MGARSLLLRIVLALSIFSLCTPATADEPKKPRDDGDKAKKAEKAEEAPATEKGTATGVPEYVPPEPHPERMVWLKKLGLSKDCQQNPDTLPEKGANVTLYELGDGRKLVEFFCYSAAYQFELRFFLMTINDGKEEFKPLSFDICYTKEDGSVVREPVPAVVGVGGFDPEKKRLDMFTKGRGLGDCGTQAAYEFNGDTFELLEILEDPNCDGELKWNRLYPEN